tara:strand:- start:1184 stop:2452 length:1269 start_codon:yes stop_codon:yes gene_type:complete
MAQLFSKIINDFSKKEFKILSFYNTIEASNIVTLIPTGHAAYYPLQFNKSSRKIIEGELNFFNKNLYENYYKPKELLKSDFKLEIVPRNEKCLLVNLLDSCYGHSLLKLFNLIKIHQKFQDDFDIIVIVPESLEYLIPKDKFTICTIKISYYNLTSCYDLDPILEKVKKKYISFDCATTSTYEQYTNKNDLIKFFLNNLKNNKQNNIIFYYRSDRYRKWNGRFQGRNITKLYQFLKPYFSSDVKFIILGELDNYKFPSWIVDKRVEKYSNEVDIDYNQEFSKSALTIGLLGSNLVLPSLLSLSTLHLVPNHKRHNALEDSVPLIDSTFNTWYSNLQVFGNSSLNTIKPNDLFSHIIILFSSFLEKKYKQDILKAQPNKPHINQNLYIKEKYSFFNYGLAKEYKQKLERKSFIKLRIRSKLGL